MRILDMNVQCFELTMVALCVMLLVDGTIQFRLTAILFELSIFICFINL